MSVSSRIRRQGGAAILTIPASLMRQLQVDVGSEMSLEVEQGQLLVRPMTSTKRRYRLSELLRGSDALAALNSETAWAREGGPVGRELA